MRYTNDVGNGMSQRPQMDIVAHLRRAQLGVVAIFPPSLVCHDNSRLRYFHVDRGVHE